jgi:hypothetical protein
VSDVGSGSSLASGGSQLPKKFPAQASRKALYQHPSARTIDETGTEYHDLRPALSRPLRLLPNLELRVCL